MKTALPFWILGILLSMDVYASADIPGSRDPVAVERFSGSWIIHFNQIQQVDHRLILGILKKIDGTLQPEREARLQGQLQRVTYQVPKDYALKSVVQHWQAATLGEERELLFQCQGRECGSSSFWANRIFGIPELYGPDEEQFYQVSRETHADTHVFYAVYVIRRGNRRIYAQIEILQVPARDGEAVSPDPEAMISLLKRERRLVLRDVRFAEGSEELLVSEAAQERIVQAISSQPTMPIAVVAHAYSMPDTQANLTLSRRRAEKLLTFLQGKVIAPKRLSAHGVGSLSPRRLGDRMVDRVELVLP